MQDIYTIGAEYRARLLKEDESATTELLATYARAFGSIEKALNGVLVEIGNNPDITRDQLFRLDRYDQLQREINKEIQILAPKVSTLIAHNQINAISLASQASHAQVSTVKDLGQHNHRANVKALTALTGHAGNGTPLDTLLKSYGGDAAQDVKDILTDAIAKGKNPKDVANEIKAAWGNSALRALSLSRTETLRAYREGLRNNYQSNSDIISGYQWLCAKSKRTCAACLASDGEIFDLDTPQKAHVNCRCTMIPVLKTRELPARMLGKEWFDEQDSATQEKILGNTGYKAYKGGTSLDDFIYTIKSDAWGEQRIQKTPNK